LDLKSKQVSEFKETDIGKIPVDWKITQLDNICIKITDGSHLSPQQVDSGTKRIASVKDMKNNDFDFYSCKIISDSDFEQLEKNGCKPLENDVLFSKDGTMGISFVYKNIKNLVLLSSIAIIRTNSEISPYFLNFYLRNKIIQNYLISGYSSGSALPRIVLKDLKKLLVIVPKMFEQEKIVKILYDLDTKIESLQNQNHALEQMAQAIFKSWFVDFDGVTEFENLELGQIPKGWKIGKIKDVIEIFDGKRIPLSKMERAKRKGNIPYYGATTIIDFIDDYIFDGKFLLLGEDGSVVQDDGTPFIQYVTGKFWANNHAHVIQGKNSFSTEFVYLFFKNLNINPWITGAVQLKVNQSNLLSIPIIMANANVLKKFNQIIFPIFSNLLENEKSISILTKTRDILLPKLMSGEIRV
jgi:type I restriction enzyme, S subunit